MAFAIIPHWLRHYCSCVVRTAVYFSVDSQQILTNLNKLWTALTRDVRSFLLVVLAQKF